MHHVLSYSDSYLYWCLSYICEGILALHIYITVTSSYMWDRGVTYISYHYIHLSYFVIYVSDIITYTYHIWWYPYHISSHIILAHTRIILDDTHIIYTQITQHIIFILHFHSLIFHLKSSSFHSYILNKVFPFLFNFNLPHILTTPLF